MTRRSIGFAVRKCCRSLHPARVEDGPAAIGSAELREIDFLLDLVIASPRLHILKIVDALSKLSPAISVRRRVHDIHRESLPPK